MAMTDDGFPASQDPRLAQLANAAQAAWLWSDDGGRILWCNDAAAAALGLTDRRDIAKPRSPADPHRRQVAQLAQRLKPDGSPRIERLRGFGARLGGLMTCACRRFALEDDEPAILIVTMEAVARLTATIAPPAAAEPPTIVAANPVAHAPAAADISEPEPPQVAPVINFEVATAPAQSEAVASPLAPPAPAPEKESAPRQLERAQPDLGATPLRFVWQIDADGKFSLHPGEFLRIAGDRTVLLQGLPWDEVAKALGLDPQGQMSEALARRETFSGIGVGWPLEAAPHPGVVELSGMPMFERLPAFAGYRGFGIYRPGVAATDDAPRADASPLETTAAAPSPDPAPVAPEPPALPDTISHTETETVEPPQNVVPFPLASEARPPTLSVHENHAFDEIARRLNERLDAVRASAEKHEPHAPHIIAETQEAAPSAEAGDRPAWLVPAAVPARGVAGRDRMLLDLIPSGILIYRLDRLLYANRAFLERAGFANLHALQEAGGLDALYVEPGPPSASSASDEGMPLRIAPSDRPPSDARLFSIDWDGEAAHALILQATPVAAPSQPAGPVAPPAQPMPIATTPDDAIETVLETASDGFVQFDRSGGIIFANRSAQTLFGFSADDFGLLNFADLFADDSQRIILDSFESLDRPGSRRLVQGREVFGRKRAGGFAPLAMTMGRTGGSGERFFALFKDLSQHRRNEADLANARRVAERATTAKADALAGVSQEIRTPLNTIIGFANVMMDQRNGQLGNERYADYLKDIRASAERALAILDDVVNISSIEAGKLDLKLAGQNLNEMVEQCVSVLQPQANRERVIIRTSLAHALPQVIADTHALRQITMNIVTSSIRSSKAGGQVIVSTAASDNGGAVLRVRDTGRALSEAELAATMGTSGVPGADNAAIDLSLARALAEANRAHFRIKTTENAGTLIEVAFANVRALAG